MVMVPGKLEAVADKVDPFRARIIAPKVVIQPNTKAVIPIADVLVTNARSALWGILLEQKQHGNKDEISCTAAALSQRR